jgi:hypothetical protein
MAPKRRRDACPAEAMKSAKKQRRAPQGTATDRASAAAAVDVQYVHHPDAAAQELAAVLGRDAANFPRIRKTDDAPPKYSVIDVVILVKGCNSDDAAKDFKRLRERYGDDRAQFPVISYTRLRDSIGRLSKHESPVAELEGIVEIILLLTGTKAAKIRQKVVKVFVRYLGGDFQ